jgi:putative ABC transport system ATP-binding protein
VRDNILYGLKHRPIRSPELPRDRAAEREIHVSEARRTGNSELDIEAEWVDYEAAGCAGPKEIEERIVHLLRVVDLGGNHLRARPAQPGRFRARPR